MKIKFGAPSLVLPMTIAVVIGIGSAEFAASASEGLTDTAQTQFVTTVAQFGTLSGTDWLSGCSFRLSGTVTLVDTNRELVVVQDPTGAVALNFRLGHNSLQVGQSVTLDGEGACLYCPGFPAYPHRPSERDVLDSFESLIDTNEYRLTRMRGYLSPLRAGEYTFWLASDNSSELWLSVSPAPSKARRIASMPRFGWVTPREWSHFPSQRSEPVLLKAGEVYYIEAIAEQTTGAEHLEVAWEGPGVSQSVIESSFLIPLRSGGDATHGILRECWTNFSAGDLDGLAGPRAFESALSVEKVRVKFSGPGQMPKPQRISLSEPFPAERNYRWVQAEGFVGFAGTDGSVVSLEFSDGHAAVQVRAFQCSPEFLRRLRNVPVRVEGVLEGVAGQTDQNGTLAPGIIWASAENSITIESAATNAGFAATDRSAQPIPATNPGKGGFYGMGGVVTFNDRVFGQDYIFVQEDTAALRIELGGHPFNRQLEVGQYLDLGGALEPGGYVQSITPLYIKDLGMHAMPSPITQPLASPAAASREGRWSELEGVVHSVNSNGMVSVVGRDGRAWLWAGQTPSNYLASYVDARLRARGVLLQTLLDAPVLLAPSRQFIDVEENAPLHPFATPGRSIAELFSGTLEPSFSHRARLIAEVTWRDPRSFFIQDTSGGVRVERGDPSVLEVGETVEVLAFPAVNGFSRALTEALVRPAKSSEHLKAGSLDLNQALSPDQNGTLVHVSATLVGRRTDGTTEVLDLEEQRRAFVATLAHGQGGLPDFALGSRLRLTGVCSDRPATGFTGGSPPKTQLPASLNILLRSPRDITVLSGPPWWTLKRTVTLVGTLLTMMMGALLWVHLLRRRLEHQQSAQLVFSRKVLERLEDERRRIAVNLHDSLGQTLMVIKNTALLAMQRAPDGEGLRPRLDEISGATSTAIEELRQITLGLRPYQLDRLGLTQAVRASINRAAADSSISFATRVEDVDGLFDPDAEIHVYRIVQEAVTNVVKHSRATEAAVVLKKRDETVSLAIRDNGRGFDATNLLNEPHRLGYGLSGIAERARILGATSTVESRPGQGANLTVEIPLPIRKNGARGNSSDR